MGLFCLILDLPENDSPQESVFLDHLLVGGIPLLFLETDDPCIAFDKLILEFLEAGFPRVTLPLEFCQLLACLR